MSDYIKAVLITGLICLALVGVLYLILNYIHVVLFILSGSLVFIPIYWVYQFVLEFIRKDKA